MKTCLIALFFAALVTNSRAQSDTDKYQIEKIVNDLADAWTNADGAAFAAHFADDHDFITWFGMYLPKSNPEFNATSHQGIFNTIYKDTRQYMVVDKIRFVNEDVALVHVFGALSNKDENRPGAPDVLISLVMQKKDQNWQIVSLHNLDLEILENEQMQQFSPVPMAKMFASWQQNN